MSLEQQQQERIFGATEAVHDDQDWKRAIVRNELETSILRLLNELSYRGIMKDEFGASIDTETLVNLLECYEEALLYAMQYSNGQDEHISQLLNHSWVSLCHYQTLRLDVEQKRRWLWKMAQRIHELDQSLAAS